MAQKQTTPTKTEGTARLRYLRVAPRKTRLTANLIRGLSVANAQAQLLLSPRRSSEHFLKLLASAVANAKQHGLQESKLVIKEIRVDEGPRLKRWMPRARGMVSPIHKKMSHITITVADGDIARKPRFVIPKTERKQKPEKQEKKSTAQDHKKDGAQHQETDVVHRDTEASKPKHDHKPKPTSRPGGLKGMFRRKSI